MIFFVSSYDEATKPNLDVARLLTGNTHALFERDATRDALWVALAQSGEKSVLAMSHGRRQYLRAQYGNHPHAIMLSDAPLLGARRVFAWACLTSAELGKVAAESGTIWFGFPVRIAAPPDDPRLQSFLAHVLQIVVDGLDAVHDEATCRILLDQLVDAAQKALNNIEALWRAQKLSDQDYDSVVQQCFEQFQLRLEAWLPDSNEPIRPSRAPTRRYDDLDPARDLAG